MATSGTVTLSKTRNDIIRRAVRLLGLSRNRGALTPDQTLDASYTLNAMLKAWEADDIGTWLRDEACVFLNKGTSIYSLGPSGDHATMTALSTTTNAAHVATDTSITVTDSSSFTANDNIAIELDTGYLQWTTVDSTPDSTTIVIAVGLTSAAASGNYVYGYTTKMNRPVEILGCRIYDVVADTEWPIPIEDRNEYDVIPTKSSSGVVDRVFYDAQLTNGKLHVWQVPSDSRHYLKLTVRMPLEVFDTHSDSLHFPDQWHTALAYNLAVLLAPEFADQIDVPRVLSYLAPQAHQFYETVRGFDVEEQSIRFVPDIEV